MNPADLIQEDRPWPLLGYAPGGYHCNCLVCGKTFDGDKRCYQCLECVAIEIKKQHAANVKALEAANADRCFASDSDPACKLEYQFNQTVEVERNRRIAAEAALAEIRAENERLRSALKPFASFSTHKTSYVELPVVWCIAASRSLGLLGGEVGG